MNIFINFDKYYYLFKIIFLLIKNKNIILIIFKKLYNYFINIKFVF